MQNGLLRLAAYAGCVSTLIILFGTSNVTLFEAKTKWLVQEAQSAAVFFVQSITAAQIQNNYQDAQSAKKVRILIVPGHQTDTGGTEFNGVHERDIVVDIANTLAELLAQNPHYDTMISRTKSAWNPILQTYFDTHALEIETFKQSQALQMANYIASGRFILEDDQVYHNTAPSAAALQLYGINKWTSDNEYDMTLHLHLNDYAGRRARSAGEYDGFMIYVPDSQYSNAAASRAIAEAITARLNRYHATSTLPKEDIGIVEDRELIAVGSNNSADGAALLIEYGYIYEPQFQESSVRSVAIADYAYQTYLGLQDFFGDPISPTFGSVSFPYDWSDVDAKKGESGPGVYALQAALRYFGYYPPVGKSFSDCPVSGVARVCTRDAIMAYQRAHGLEATGVVGPQTRATLSRETAR